MEFYFDVDGVILDFEMGFMDFMRATRLPDLPKDFRPQNWEIQKDFTGIDMGVAWEEFVDSPGFKRLEPLVEVKLFNHWAERYPVHLVTNLPYRLRAAREENLHFWGLEFASLNLGGHWNFGSDAYPSKPEVIASICDPTRTLYFLDDHPTNCAAVQERFPQAKVLLVTQPHNQNQHLPFTRVHSLNEFLRSL